MGTRKYEVITYGHGGWIRYQSQDLEVPVFVRFELRDDRLAPVDLFVPALDDGTLSAVLLRKIPLGRIEAWVNDPASGGKVIVGLRKPGPDLRRAVGAFTTSRPRKGGSWVADMLWAQVPGAGVFQPSPGRLAERLDDDETPLPDLTLDKPERRPYGDDFYRRVAEVYQSLLGLDRAPAGAIADANHVAVSKVHRWIKEARRRGFLPPGRQGKAG